MSYKNPNSKLSLDVSNPNDKVEQLRRQFAQEPDRGREPQKNEANKTPIDRALEGKPADVSRLEERIIDAIRTVYDPELPINVYDLGLIYRIEIQPVQGADPASHHVAIDMTLTAPNCPVAGELPAAVQRAAARVPGVAKVDVQLVWEPRWGRDRMSEAALLELGLL